MTKKIYLDYQATTPVDPTVLEKMLPFFSENFGNPHSNNHQYGKFANDAVEDARQAVANLINAENEEIIFTFIIRDNFFLFRRALRKRNCY